MDYKQMVSIYLMWKIFKLRINESEKEHDNAVIKWVKRNVFNLKLISLVLPII